MTFPKIEHPIISIIVPSNKMKLNFRPMLVKEEKILLMAKESNDDNDIFFSLFQIVNNCCVSEYNIEELSTFDIDYIFLKLVAASIENVVNITVTDANDKKKYNFEIDLNSVDVLFPEDKSTKIEIDSDFGIILKYPNASLYKNKSLLAGLGDDNIVDTLLVSSIKEVYKGDKIVIAENNDEVKEFVENLSIPVYRKIRKFVLDSPTLYHKIDYKNSLNEDRFVEMRSLSDFFDLR